jgi:prefoldin subunit 2
VYSKISNITSKTPKWIKYTGARKYIKCFFGLFRTVIDTLKTVDDDRKCFRQIGGVLCEQNVKTVLPQLVQNKDQLEQLIEIGKDQIAKKGIEINQFKDVNNIKIRGQEPTAGDIGGDDKTTEASNAGGKSVLVNN